MWSENCRREVSEEVKLVAGCLAESVVLAWLFYHSWKGMILFVPLYYLMRKAYQKKREQKQRMQLLWEFKEAMQAVSAALLAGYSMEKAWREAEKEVNELYGEGSQMYQELCHMNAAVRMNQPLELVLQEFAERSGCEEIESFAAVFSYAKRGGGDFVGIIQTTVQKLVGKMEVDREIATVLAGRKLEGRIMNLMPILILAYLNVSAGDFLQVLYGNAFGVVIMSVALVIYGAAVKWSEHILDIKV